MTDTQSNQLSTLYNQYVLHEGDKVLLWTNPSPGSGFDSQTIIISSGYSSYRYLIIACLITNASSFTESDLQRTLISTSTTSAFTISGGGYTFRGVRIYPANKTIFFANGSNNVSGSNTFCVPAYIYGI